MTGPDSEARRVILDRLRTALAHTDDVAGHASGPTGASDGASYRRRGERSAQQRREVFVDRLDDYGARVLRCGASREQVRASLAEAMTEHQVSTVVAPARVAREWLAGSTDTRGTRGPSVVVDDAGLRAADLAEVDAVVTGCALGIAETGVIVLDGGPWSGRRLISLVPDLHLCVVHLDDVVDLPPEAVERLDPRAPQTWVAGPSATSDIELQRVQGVHGPRTLVVILAG